ncbi:MAG: PBP1A family penicillin-binding protein [Defluviicoccus sp.]|nr:PBP1A family penicillin-binding protein [Defluviicoccus sp.]MDE0275821.1 PBP1A family penicillin-binding protein [Defluviicoccus sp.]
MAPRRTGKESGKGEANRKSGGARRGWVARLARWALVLGIWVGVAVAGAVAWYAWDLPDLSRLETPTRRPAVLLRTVDGAVLARYGQLYGGAVRFDELPGYFVEAVSSIEDRRFFEHPGIDVWGILRAAVANIRAGEIRQGGSTLTQQLAKNLFLTPERTVRRKIQEAIVAFWLEARFSKRQIFEIYINRVYFGSGAYGAAAAARRYFGGTVRDLSLFEAAVLAGLLKAPSRYSPARDADAARARGLRVLRAMVDAGKLTEVEAEAARRTPLRLREETGAGARYFADWTLERAVGHIGRTSRDVEIRTTLDSRLQRIAERHARGLLAKAEKTRRVSQVALVAMSFDGAVRAMVGGKVYSASQFNRATQARRQPGSAFKLFVYLAGLEAGLTPDSVFVDRPIGVAGWRPRNYDGRFHGAMPLERAFARSINTVAVQVSERAGRRRVIDAARRLGITTPIAPHPSLALGASEVTLIELTAAYASVANGGVAVWPWGVASVDAVGGKRLYRRTGGPQARVIERDRVRALGRMLREAVRTGTGRAARLGGSEAGKTGTSQSFRDAWFVGFAGDLVAGVWVGNDDDRPMKKVTGGGLPARIWRAFMRDAAATR